ncbi:hypothetical protein HPB50_003869 [Hyalomma asiaticum]|uniref:Uncharacterized protein n=1 Tax=Hyalomma asiaticum TaxID=266040 RepID=A0ACB7TES4_HYAAI|nr:hypothetical protein HPB50_003869 [Hyalomma asiaticum]
MGTSCSSNGARSEDAGIIPRAVQDIFRHISTNTEKIFLVRVSFLEIYKEDVFDLFSKKSDRESLQIQEDQTGAIKISNLTELNVTTPEETIRLLAVGSASRSTASTNMNMRSSRSHAIFTLIIEQQEKSSGDTITVAKFHLVDLAGSEKAGKAKAVGERLKEGVTIDQGLLSLGNVITALCDGSSHVPYQNSKLTRLLQDSLGGNSHTVMIACVSPADSNFEETLNTLQYADRARKIENKPVVKFNPVQAEVAQLRQQRLPPDRNARKRPEEDAVPPKRRRLSTADEPDVREWSPSSGSGVLNERTTNDDPLAAIATLRDVKLPNRYWTFHELKNVDGACFTSCSLNASMGEVKVEKAVFFTVNSDGGPDGGIHSITFVQGKSVAEAAVVTMLDAKAVLNQASLLHLCKGVGTQAESLRDNITVNLQRQLELKSGSVFNVKCLGSTKKEGTPCFSCKYLRKAFITRQSRIRKRHDIKGLQQRCEKAEGVRLKEQEAHDTISTLLSIEENELKGKKKLMDTVNAYLNKQAPATESTLGNAAEHPYHLQEVMIELMRCRTLGKGVDQPGGNDNDESKKEIALVLSRNAELENENQRLTGELYRALDELSESSKCLIMTELEVQKLKELVVQLSERIENSQLADGDDQATRLLKNLQNSIMEFSADEQKRRKLNENLFKVEKPACEREMTTIEEEGLVDGTTTCAAEQTAPKTLLNQSRLEVTMRQDALSKGLEELNRVPQAKEELASKIAMNDQHLEVMKMQFENELLVVSESKNLEHRLSSLIEERKAIAIEINTVEKQLNDPDMAEHRSICNTRMQELNDTLQEHCDKFTEVQKKIVDAGPDNTHSSLDVLGR